MTPVLPDDPLVGQVIDNRYKIAALIARGGMAKVYKADQFHLNRVVAIKVLDPKNIGADDPGFQKRFELEAQMTSQLNHPNTVTIHDYGFNAQRNFYYFVMEFISGRTLRKAMKDEGAFTVARSLHIAEQIAKSVRQAHSVGVFHRDLKPSNVLLTKHDDDENFVKVVDFGLLKLRRELLPEGEKAEATLMGSPRYMSPEQIKRAAIDHRTDIYSLGVNLYQMLTGAAPFSGTSTIQILMGHLNQAPQRFGAANPAVKVPEKVEQFVLRCLEKSPDRRPADMNEVLETLQGFIKGTRAAVAPAARAAPPPLPPPLPPARPSIQLKTPVRQRPEPPPLFDAKDKGGLEENPSQPSSPSGWSDSVSHPSIFDVADENAIPPPPPAPAPTIPIDVMPTEKERRKGEPRKPVSIFVWMGGIAAVFFAILGIASLIVIKTTSGKGVATGPGARAGGAAAQQHAATQPEKAPPVKTAQEDAVQEPAPIPPPPGEQPPPAEKPQMRIFRLKFASSPPEAYIFEGENALCVTPCDVEWVVTPGEKETTRTFTVVKEGFDLMEIKQATPNSDVTFGVIALTPISTGTAPPGKKGKPAAAGAAPPPPPAEAGAPKETKPLKKPPAEPKPPKEKKPPQKEKEGEGLKLIQDYPDA